MQRLGILLVLVAALAACEKKAEKSASAEPAPPPAMDFSKLEKGPGFNWYDVQAKAPLADEIKAQVEAAAADGKRPVAYLHADWCPPCKAIDATVRTDDRMKAAFKGTHIISIDVDRADPAVLDSLGLTSDSIPAFFHLDTGGHAAGEKITGGAWAEDVPANMAPPLAAYFARN